jgi:hypothetical protein
VAQPLDEKQCFMRTMQGGEVDRFPFFDLEPADETIERWRREGLPPNRSVAEHFGLERHRTVGPVVRSYPFYRPAPDLLTDPDAFARHYDPDQPSRYADDFVEKGEGYIRQGRVLYVDASGGGLLQMLGVHGYGSMVDAMLTMVDDPARVEALVDRTTDFHCLCLERVLSRLPIDYANFYEPIASNKGPVVSPAMFERFSMPGYRKVLGLMDKYDVPLRFFCTTGGDLSLLLPMVLEAGINGLWISNIASAGMRYGALRKRYGSHLALIGGIDSGSLTRGREAVRRTIEETVPPLLAEGRYLPCLDDRPRRNVPFAMYRYYREVLAEIASRG